jgi:hypothetical protein
MWSFDILHFRLIDLCFITTQYIIDHLLTIVGALVSFGAGYWTARRLQDRETKARLKGIALALKEEVQRIRSEIGGPLPANLDELVIAGIVPDVHPWVQGIIAEAARTNPAIVAAFMRLERLLYNQRWSRDSYKEDMTALAVAQERYDRVSDGAEGDEEIAAKGDEEIAEEIGEHFEARRKVQVSEDNLRRTRGLVIISLRQVHRVLDELEELLTKAAE